VFDWEERWRTPDGPYVHKACAPSREAEPLSRGIAAVEVPATTAAVRALAANEDECSCLILKLRGSRFPVKDTGIEGSLADPFFEIRASYVIGAPHVGEHDTEPAYKSKKVRQDLNPHFRTIAIDLRKLCGLDLQRKLLLDFYDWDRFSAPDFMSYIEVTAQELLDLKGSPKGLFLRPPPAPHKQEVGELWVDRAELAYPQVHIGALERKVADKVLHKVAKIRGSVPDRSPDIHITNETSIPLKVWITSEADVYRSAVVGKFVGQQGAWSDLAAGESELYRRPDESRETYILILSPNNKPLVLATFALGSYLPGSKTKPIALSFDLDSPSAHTFSLTQAVQPGGAGGDAGGAGVQASNEPVAAASKGFKVTMSLKLRGNGLPVKDHGLMGGKSDPYYQIRPAFGAPGGIPYVSPNKDSRGNDLPTRNYEGAHRTRAFLESEVVANQLNPVWSTQLLDLNALFAGTGVVDLSKKILVDIWDSDRQSHDDFMCYREVSLQQLMDAAASGRPLELLPPPEGQEQDVGRLYVDRAIIGFPQVEVRPSDKRKGADAQGLVLANCTPVGLRVLVAADAAEYQQYEVGQLVADLCMQRCVVCGPARDACIPAGLLGGANVAMLCILNESNLIVGKKSVPGAGSKELHMDLEGGSWALSAGSVKSTLAINYRQAVQRVGNVSDPEVTLSEADVDYFMEQRRHAADVALLLPLFGQGMEDDCLDLESYEAYLNAQIALLKRAISEATLDEVADVDRVSNWLHKLHVISSKCEETRSKKDDMAAGLPDYDEMAQVLVGMLENLSNEALSCLEQRRFSSLAQALTVLKHAGASRLRQHVQDPALMESKYAVLVDKILQLVSAQHGCVLTVLEESDRSGLGLSDTDAAALGGSWEVVEQAARTSWAYEIGGASGEHLTSSELKALLASGQEALLSSLSSQKASLEAVAAAVLAAGGEGKLARVSRFLSNIDVLCGLANVPMDVPDGLLLQALDEAREEVEGVLRQVAVFCSSDAAGDSSSRPSLAPVAGRVRELLAAKACVGRHNAAAHHQKIVASIVGIVSEVTEVLFSKALASATGATHEGMMRVLYSAEQIQKLIALADEHADTFPAPARGGVDAAALLHDMTMKLAQQLEQRVTTLLPSPPQPLDASPPAAPPPADLDHAVTVDGAEADKLMQCIEALVAYAKAGGDGVVAAKYEAIQHLFKSGMQAVVLGKRCRRRVHGAGFACHAGVPAMRASKVLRCGCRGRCHRLGFARMLMPWACCTHQASNPRYKCVFRRWRAMAPSRPWRWTGSRLPCTLLAPSRSTTPFYILSGCVGTSWRARVRASKHATTSSGWLFPCARMTWQRSRSYCR